MSEIEVQSGKPMLAVSSSQFGRTRTFGRCRAAFHLRGVRSLFRQCYPLENVAVAALSAACTNGEARWTRPSRSALSTPDHDRYRVVVHRFPNDILSAVGGHLHANPIFFRTPSHPVSWNVASWPGPSGLANTLIFSRAPSGSDRSSSPASPL
jgi:hypothetical protein